MTASPNMGFARRVGVAATAPTTKELEFLSCTVKAEKTHVQSDGIRGVRGRQAEGVVDGPYTVRGQLVMEPRPDEWDIWLPYMLGAGTNPNFTLAETVPDFVLDVDKGDDVYRYAGCKVDTWTINSQSGQPVRLTLGIEGKTETGGITFPSISATLSLLQPYIHHQQVLTINSIAYEQDNFELGGNNGLVNDRFNNSQTRTGLPEGDRIITMASDFPNGDTIDPFTGLAVAGLGGNVKWTNGAYSLLFTFGVLQAPTIGAEIGGRIGEIIRRISWQARRTGSTQELVCVNDSTP